ncbi:MAG: hypothetical protein AAGI38_07985 [Bacteroidota bacterium]
MENFRKCFSVPSVSFYKIPVEVPVLGISPESLLKRPLLIGSGAAASIQGSSYIVMGAV